MREPDPTAHELLLERRVDRAGGGQLPRRAGQPRKALGAGALLTAVALGFQHVFDPPDDDEVVLEVEAGEPLDDRWVAYDHDPCSPRRSRATIRPWLRPAS